MKRAKRNLAWIVAIALALAWIAYRLDLPYPGAELVALVTPDAPRVRGVVRHVLVTGTGREAIVELDDGDSVTAAIPASCIVSPGQRAELRSERVGFGARRYTVRSSWDLDI